VTVSEDVGIWGQAGYWAQRAPDANWCLAGAVSEDVGIWGQAGYWVVGKAASSLENPPLEGLRGSSSLPDDPVTSLSPDANVFRNGYSNTPIRCPDEKPSIWTVSGADTAQIEGILMQASCSTFFS